MNWEKVCRGCAAGLHTTRRGRDVIDPPSAPAHAHHNIDDGESIGDKKS